MNKAELIDKVAAMTGVDAAVCTQVIEAMQKVLQKELASSGGGGLLDKIGGVVNFLKGETN